MSAQTIQAIRVHQYGGPEELKLRADFSIQSHKRAKRLFASMRQE